MTEVVVKGNLDSALKKFKHRCSQDGIPSEAKKRRFYDKPSKFRREEEKKNIRNSRKKNRDR